VVNAADLFQETENFCVFYDLLENLSMSSSQVAIRDESSLKSIAIFIVSLTVADFGICLRAFGAVHSLWSAAGRPNTWTGSHFRSAGSQRCDCWGFWPDCSRFCVCAYDRRLPWPDHYSHDRRHRRWGRRAAGLHSRRLIPWSRRRWNRCKSQSRQAWLDGGFRTHDLRSRRLLWTLSLPPKAGR
jgi:hypothetical protein